MTLRLRIRPAPEAASVTRELCGRTTWTSFSRWAATPATRPSSGPHQALSSLIAARSRYPEAKAPVHLVYGENDWSRPSDRQANKKLLPAADFTQIPTVGHFIALERPDALADLLNAAA